MQSRRVCARGIDCEVSIVEIFVRLLACRLGSVLTAARSCKNLSLTADKLDSYMRICVACVVRTARVARMACASVTAEVCERELACMWRARNGRAAGILIGRAPRLRRPWQREGESTLRESARKGVILKSTENVRDDDELQEFPTQIH